MITRTADWKASLAGLPLDVEITDPRGLIVSRTQLKLSAASFDEVTYTSQPASPTGTYQAVAYLAKDERRRETLGSTSFKVQEFEPDRMKVQLELSSDADRRLAEARRREGADHASRICSASRPATGASKAS